jgi:DNA-directed RNA polymerase alpha subunit
MRSSGDLPVEELQLPRGPYNALRRANVRTLTDLLALPVEDIAGIPSLGGLWLKSVEG